MVGSINLVSEGLGGRSVKIYRRSSLQGNKLCLTCLFLTSGPSLKKNNKEHETISIHNSENFHETNLSVVKGLSVIKRVFSVTHRMVFFTVIKG